MEENLWSSFTETSACETLDEIGAIYEKHSESESIKITAQQLADGKAVGWFNGRMEFGPGVLGACSIIADPRSPVMQKQLNLKVKYRESIRPFAPSLPVEDLSDWFELDESSPYMLIVEEVHKHKRVSMYEEQQKLFGFENSTCRVQRYRRLLMLIVQPDTDGT